MSQDLQLTKIALASLMKFKECNADSEKEARMAYTEALKVEGQAELFEGV